MTITTKYPLVAGSKIRTGVLLLPARASHLQKHRVKNNFIYIYFFFIRYTRGGKKKNIITVGEIIKEHGIFLFYRRPNPRKGHGAHRTNPFVYVTDKTGFHPKDNRRRKMKKKTKKINNKRGHTRTRSVSRTKSGQPIMIF